MRRYRGGVNPGTKGAETSAIKNIANVKSLIANFLLMHFSYWVLRSINLTS